jgi:DNA repair protein RadA/Sms
MMAKLAKRYVCQACGSVTSKWAGQCGDCGEWNAIIEEAGTVVTAFSARHDLRTGGRPVTLAGLNEAVELPPRISTDIAEFDRALGGGLVAGSATLIGGDPGIGKSTLLLQVAAKLALRGLSVAYVSGEEATDQVRLRARRLGLGDAPVQLAAATSVRDILATFSAGPAPALLIVDSIQTMHSDVIEGAPGTVGQVRASAQELIRFAKDSGCALVLVGHVTKDGTLAGPRVLEHMVDTVLGLEGERSHQYRILRAVKNRFGGTDEIGVFVMDKAGLGEVANPSRLFGLSFSTAEVYLNVAGGYRITDPAADLAVAAALVSSLAERPIPAEAIAFGEVALSGELRQVAHAALRLKEAAKLGFGTALVPAGTAKAEGIRLTSFAALGNLVDHLLGRG